MVVNFKELIEGIEEYVTTYLPGIQFVEYNYDVNREGKQYPALFYFWDQDGQIGENVNTATVTFIFCDLDKVNGGNKPDHEIHSECITYASQLMDYLQRNNFFGGELGINQTPFTGRYNNGLTGVSISVPLILTKPGYNV